ncbi:MAG: BTAD domain-containing putative transcriptional regulator [Gemmatimonadales bacterium]
MISLQLLGGLALRLHDGDEAQALLSQPKRIALLAYLILGQPAGLKRRDSIIALLWPETGQERARNSLRQGLHQLRRILGPEALTGRGSEEVGVAPGAIECDVLSFQAACRAREWEAALGLYRGDLLPGFHLADAPEFGQWLDEERTRLRALAVRAAAALAGQAEGAGNLPAAVEWAERGLALAPADEARALELVRLLDLAGDRTGALQAYESFVSSLARDYDLEPTPALARLIEEIRRRPPRRATLTGSFPIAPEPARASIQPGLPSRRRRWPLALTAVVAGVMAIVALGYRRGAGLRPASGAGEVAILPFRVAGADPSLAYLREGMIDLLAAKLTGEEGRLKATDPRIVINAYRRATGDSTDIGPDESRRLAAGLGAGRVLLGGVVGRASRLMLQAAVYDVAGGEVRARGSAEGSMDSLPELVDELAAELLAGELAGSGTSLPVLKGTALPAVRAYLEGEQAYRAGRYAVAYARYLEAVGSDSTFGPAAVGLAAAGIWYPTAEGERQRGLRLAWAVRERLGTADRVLFEALAGPRYPAVSPWRERLEAWERATIVAAGRPEAWYEYGDILMHRGPLLGIAGSAELAQRAFARAVALDSSFAPPLSHLFDLAAASADTLAMKADAALFLARDSASDLADYIRWRRAAMGDDPRLLAAIRRRMPVMSDASLSRIIGASQLDGMKLDDAVLAARILASRPLRRDQQAETDAYLMELALNRGRPKEAAALVAAMANRSPGEDAQLAAHIFNALYADGDSAAGSATADRFRVYLRAAPPSSGEPRALHLWKACAAAQWGVWHGDTTAVARTILELRRPGTALPWWAPANFEVCASILDAAIATLLRRPDARDLVARLDSLTLTGPDVDVRDPATVALARLWARLGEPARALDAIRRRQYHHRTGLPYLATRLRQEGEWALATGDTTAARLAWRHFLVLYAEADGPGRRLGDSVRAFIH